MIEITPIIAHIILGSLSTCFSEGISYEDCLGEIKIEDLNREKLKLMATIKELYPDLAKEYSYLWE